MSGKPIDEAVRLLREYREAPKFSNDHDAIKRTVALEDEIDAFLAAPPPSAPVVDEAMTRRIMADFHANDPGDVWPPDEQGRLRMQALQDAINKHISAAPALSQQPAAVGEEIMVNAAHDVFTLPLQPSGLSSGPRFVVHVPAPEQQPAAVDEAMVERAAAAVMSAPPGISVEAYVRIVLEAALAAQRQEPKS